MVRRVSMLAGLLALGLLLSGCDKCTNWWWYKPGAEACRDTVPK